MVLILGIACESSTPQSSQGEESLVVTGLIMRVESLSLTELTVLDLQDEAGKIWTFEAQGKRFPQFMPSHLREHQVLGLKVQVQYHEDAAILVIDSISD